MDYYCSECGKEAYVSKSGDVRRSCEHDAPILAPRRAVLFGEGGANSPTSIRDLIIHLLKK